MARVAEKLEADGFDGLAVVDSQNLSGDPYVALALAAKATSRLGLATGVTNPYTRHPAATACSIASVQAVSGGRAVLGIGRGDTALFHLGMKPVDRTIKGTLHSHPDPHPYPSDADFELFEHEGVIHLILGQPYGEDDWRAYDHTGVPTFLEVVP